jgi:hypothetical protein
MPDISGITATKPPGIQPGASTPPGKVPGMPPGVLPGQPNTSKPLPYAAIGLTPKGEAYYGEGIDGWLRKMGAMALDPQRLFGSILVPSQTDPSVNIPILEKYGATLPSITLKPGEVLSPEQAKSKLAEEKKQLGNIDAGEWLKIIGQDPGALLRTAGSLLKTGFVGAMDVLNQPQVGVRKLMAAGLANKMMADIQRNYPSMTRAEITTKFMSGSEMIYTAWLDENKQNEYMREILDGTPPAFVIEKLSNPWIELAGSILLDPMWLFPVGKAGQLKKVSEVQDFAEIGDDGIRAAAKLMATTKDGMMAEDTIRTGVDAGKAAIKAVAEKQNVFADAKGIFAKTLASKAYITKGRLNRVLGFLGAQVGKDTTEMGEIVMNMIRAGSADEGAANMAWMALYKSPYAKVLLSPSGLETQLMLQKIAGDNPLKFLDEVVEFAGKNDVKELAKVLTDKMSDAIDNVYPTFKEMEKAALAVKGGAKATARTARLVEQYDKLKPAEIKLAHFDQFLQEKLILGKWGYKDLNALFSGLYMGMNPGYAMRNMLNGTVHLLVDSGPKVAAEGFTWGLKGTIGGILGKHADTLFNRQIDDMIEWGADPYFSRMMSGQGIASDIIETHGTGILKARLRGGTEGERGMSSALWGHSFKQEMERAFRQGAIPRKSVLMEAGLTQEAAERLVDRVLSTHDIRKGVALFRKELATGKINMWEHVQIDPYLRDFLDSPALNLRSKYQEILNAKYANKEEAAVAYEGFVHDFVAMVKKAVASNPVRNADDPESIKMADQLASLVKESGGLFTEQAADKFGELVNLERESRLYMNSAAREVESYILQQYGHGIPEDIARAARSAETDLIENMGPRIYSDWDKVVQQIRTINKQARGEADLKNLGKIITDLAEKNHYPVPKFDFSSSEAFRQSLWDWKSLAGNEHFVSFSKLYNQRLWGEVVAPLAKSAGIDISTNEKLAAFLVENGLDTLVPKLNRAKQDLENAAELVKFPSVEEWTQVKKYAPSQAEIDASFKETVKARNIISKYSGEFGPKYVFPKNKTPEALAEAEAKLKPGEILITGDNMIGQVPENVRFQAYQRHLEKQAEVSALRNGETTILKKLENTKVVDDAGKPLRVFHGTKGDFTEFDASAQKATDSGFFGKGFYFSPSAEEASAYAEKAGSIQEAIPGANVRPVFLDIKNPFKAFGSASMDNFGGTPEEITKTLMAKGYDGVISYGEGNKVLEVVAFDAKQVIPAISPDVSVVSKLEQLIKQGEPTASKVEDLLKVRSTVKPPDVQHSIPEAINEQLENVVPVMRMHNQKVLNSWGVQKEVFTNPSVEAALTKWEAEGIQKFSEARAVASAVSDAKRDFALLNYGDKMNIDHYLSYIFPYHFWYGRTYKNWMERIISDPKIALAYVRYRKTLEQVHAGMPDWWKYQLSTNDLPGMDSENPIYFNLEATLNPLQGLVGVDFNDPNKRVNWWSRTIDDIGKFGPTLFTPINWLVAGLLYWKGEEDASVRWMGRLVPQTAMLKAVSNKLGVKTPIPYNELDPFVQVFSGGLDPFERRRVGRALGQMVDDGQISAAAAQEAAHSQTGDIWQNAAQIALGARAGGYLSSFFMGTGFKSRSQSDLQIDEFYSSYFNLWNMKGNLSPDAFNESMRQLREKYPWMDVILISRRPDNQRDSALAYSVMSRIPPGQKSELAKLTDIDDLLTRFYDSKGDFTGWTQPDKTRFMAGIADLSAVLAVPDNATARDYALASDGYAAMNKELQSVFGGLILDGIDRYFQAGSSEEKDGYLLLHPDVKEALQYKDRYILTHPALAKYYGGINVLERYYASEMYAVLDKEFPDIGAKWTEYNRLQLLNSRAATAYKRANLDAYTRRKDALRENIFRIIAKLGSKLPEESQVPIREDLLRPSARQEEIIAATQPEQRMTWQDWQMVLSEPMQALILDYVQSGRPLSYQAESQLDYIAKQFGMYDGNQALQNIMIALQQAQQ